MPNSYLKFRNYDEIVKHFGRDVVKERFEELLALYQHFIDSQNLKGKVVIDGMALGNAVMDYFSDISRIKDFHPIEKVNTTKICAYECSWLLRRKPLQILQPDEDCAFCNEQFIFLRILQHLSEDSIKIDEISSIFNNEKMLSFMETLIYFIKYPTVSPQTLELAFQSFIAGKTFQSLSEKSAKI